MPLRGARQAEKKVSLRKGSEWKILTPWIATRGGARDTIERRGVENLHAPRVDSRAAEPVANRFCRSEKDGLIELRAQRVVQRVMHATLGAFRKDQPTLG